MRETNRDGFLNSVCVCTVKKLVYRISGKKAIFLWGSEFFALGCCVCAQSHITNLLVRCCFSINYWYHKCCIFAIVFLILAWTPQWEWFPSLCLCDVSKVCTIFFPIQSDKGWNKKNRISRKDKCCQLSLKKGQDVNIIQHPLLTRRHGYSFSFSSKEKKIAYMALFNLYLHFWSRGPRESPHSHFPS